MTRKRMPPSKKKLRLIIDSPVFSCDLVVTDKSARKIVKNAMRERDRQLNIISERLSRSTKHTKAYWKKREGYNIPIAIIYESVDTLYND